MKERPLFEWNLVFTGGRDYLDIEQFNSILFVLDLDGPGRPTKIHVGDCPTGLDRMVRDAFVDAHVHNADWGKYGKGAGPKRNGEMLKAAGPHSLVIAFPGGFGTFNCIRQAMKLGLNVMVVERRLRISGEAK